MPEVLQVMMRMKADKVCAQEALQHFLATRQDGKNVRSWKRDVKEESNGGFGKFLSKHIGQEHQVIVMNPDPVSWAIFIDDRMAESAVRFDVGFPVLTVELQFRCKTVK